MRTWILLVGVDGAFYATAAVDLPSVEAALAYKQGFIAGHTSTGDFGDLEVYLAEWPVEDIIAGPFHADPDPPKGRALQRMLAAGVLPEEEILEALRLEEG